MVLHSFWPRARSEQVWFRRLRDPPDMLSLFGLQFLSLLLVAFRLPALFSSSDFCWSLLSDLPSHTQEFQLPKLLF